MSQQKPAAAPPLKRARAPTITVDTSALNENEQSAPEFSSPTSAIGTQNPNSLVIPVNQRPRGDSLESTNSISTSSIGSQTYVGSSASQSLRERSNSMNTEILNDETALKPDPGKEGEFYVENNPFAFSPGQLSKLNGKSYGAFHALRGLSGLAKGLRTSIQSGLSVDEDTLPNRVSFEDVTGTAAPEAQPHPQPSELRKRRTSTKTFGGDDEKGAPHFTDRKRVYGDNRLPERKSKSFWKLAWMALQDKVLILLSIAAVVSLALGLYQTFGQTEEKGARVEWVEGVAIMVAIAIVVLVGALNDWQKERQFVKLNRKKTDREVKAFRSGRTIKISVHDILVGDIMILEQGDVIPVDGIYISGHNVTCDESSATGESDLLKKTPADEVFKALEEHRDIRKLDPFIISGAKVSEGVGQFLVTATGVNSSHGKTLLSLRDDSEVTPLQLKLNVLAGYIAKLGSAAGLLLFVILFIEFCARLPSNKGDANEKAQGFIRVLITAVTIIVVAVPEGLPLAVTLALAFATKRMTKDNNLVRHLQSCETMGNATVICTDKTGTLTQNVMTVVGGNLGASQISFSDSNMSSRLAAMAKETLENGDMDSIATSPTDLEFNEDSPSRESTNLSQDQVSLSELSNALSSETRALLKESIAINSTAFEGEEDGKPAFIGSKTETALLDWAKNYLGLGTLSLERASLPIVQLFPFDSSKKCMAAVVKKDENTWRMFLKGAPEIVLAHSKQIIEDPAGKINGIPLTEEHNTEIQSVISTYASLSLRTIALAYRDFDCWPPKNCRKLADDPKMTEFDDVFGSLTWISVVGIQDPVRKGVSQAISDCQRAGVRVIMVTGDNIQTARAIAKETGILAGQDKSEATMEGPAFRSLNDFERSHKVQKLCVLARSSPEDKQILVKSLRSLGQVVAVTGDGTNDAQALKAADVGFSMGIAGTEVAKEASDIILMDDNFSSIVKALAWGRTVNDAVKKFLQFQITVNITAVVLTFVSAVSSDDEASVLNAVQLLWVNLIMDTFAALALATDPPSYSLLDRKPEPRHKPLIDITMWKMIIGQSIFQLVATFILYFASQKFMHFDPPNPDTGAYSHDTLVFNTFVWMQIFNALNCRRIDNHWNILEGFYKNWLFLGIIGIMIGGQVLIIFVGGAAFVIADQTGVHWAIAIIIGLLSIPIGAIIRCVPNKAIQFCLKKVLPTWVLERHQKKNAPPSEEQYLWTARVNEIRDDLAWFRKFHGGRLNELKYNITHPKHALERSRSSRSGSRSPMHSAIAMSGSLAGSIGVGDMSPIDQRPNSSFETRANTNSSRSDAGNMV